MLEIRDWLRWMALGCVLAGTAGCGDDDSAAAGGGCTTDVECKGDRVCEDGECVDPHGEGPDGGTGTRAGSGGGARDAGVAGGGSGGASAGSGASGNGSGGSPVIDDPELEEACSRQCEARQEAGCTMNIGSLDQCLAQCLVIDEANMGYCLDEQTAQYACAASGGFTCVSGYPQPKATCIEEATALSACVQMAPCRQFCAKAAGDCAPEGEQCVTECTERQQGFEDAICSIYYTQLLSCWGQSLTCENGRPAVGSCGPMIAEVADCIGLRNEECDGFCWAAETLGCGSSDCVASCKAKYDDSSCGHYYRSVLDCAYGGSELNMACQGDVPTPDATKCADAIMQFTNCKQGL